MSSDDAYNGTRLFTKYRCTRDLKTHRFNLLENSDAGSIVRRPNLIPILSHDNIEDIGILRKPLEERLCPKPQLR